LKLGILTNSTPTVSRHIYLTKLLLSPQLILWSLSSSTTANQTQPFWLASALSSVSSAKSLQASSYVGRMLSIVNSKFNPVYSSKDSPCLSHFISATMPASSALSFTLWNIWMVESFWTKIFLNLIPMKEKLHTINWYQFWRDFILMILRPLDLGNSLKYPTISMKDRSKHGLPSIEPLRRNRLRP
jgi:hypothetical protein